MHKSGPSCGCKQISPCNLNIPNLRASDTRARISVIEDNLKDVPCNQIAALVIYDLPGRDCAAKASNGELAAGDLATYKTEYIDRE